MIVSATLLANDSKAVLDRILSRHETADIHRHGKTVAQIRRKTSVNSGQLIERLKQATFTSAESRELQAAMNAAETSFTDANRH
jgi:predicted translin family RNA/ssDNA-binding protein